MTLTLTLPAPVNIHCATCLMSTEHVDLEFDLDPKGTMTCIRCQRKQEPRCKYNGKSQEQLEARAKEIFGEPDE